MKDRKDNNNNDILIEEVKNDNGGVNLSVKDGVTYVECKVRIPVTKFFKNKALMTLNNPLSFCFSLEKLHDYHYACIDKIAREENLKRPVAEYMYMSGLLESFKKNDIDRSPVFKESSVRRNCRNIYPVFTTDMDNPFKVHMTDW